MENKQAILKNLLDAHSVTDKDLALWRIRQQIAAIEGVQA